MFKNLINGDYLLGFILGGIFGFAMGFILGITCLGAEAQIDVKCVGCDCDNVSVWDYHLIDRDIIDIYLNDELIASGLVLDSVPFTFRAEVGDTISIIVISQGESGVCTIALKFDNQQWQIPGKENQIITLTKTVIRDP